MIHYRALSEQELCRELFQDFIRHQTVTKCWRKENSGWVIKGAPFIDDWTESDYDFLISCLKNTVSSGGFVYAAFSGRSLKGFSSVEAGLFGSRHQYLDLTSLHVSEDLRGSGIGTALFCAAKEWARKHGAEKLYISAHSAVETQAFYQRMGCVDTKEIQNEHTDAEPFDRQLECRV